MGKWKGMFLNICKEGESNLLLYDLETDPREQTNVASENPGIVKMLHENMIKAHHEPPLIEHSIQFNCTSNRK